MGRKKRKEEEYAAFISYKKIGGDLKFAENLQKELEHFKRPKTLKDKIKNEYPLKNSIFRDATGLNRPGYTQEQLKSNLEKSRFLIVICSPRSAENNSQWINT